MLWYLNYIFIPMNYVEFDNFIIICYDRLYLPYLVLVYVNKKCTLTILVKHLQSTRVQRPPLQSPCYSSLQSLAVSGSKTYSSFITFTKIQILDVHY